MKSIIQRIRKWFSAQETRELDRFLSRASNAADIDRLLRQWEASRHSHFNLP